MEAEPAGRVLLTAQLMLLEKRRWAPGRDLHYPSSSSHSASAPACCCMRRSLLPPPLNNLCPAVVVICVVFSVQPGHLLAQLSGRTRASCRGTRAAALPNRESRNSACCLCIEISTCPFHQALPCHGSGAALQIARRRQSTRPSSYASYSLASRSST